MKKIKTLLPSLRERNRYLAFNLVANTVHSANAISAAITQSYLQLHGTLNAGRAGIMPLFETFSRNKGVLRVNNLHVDDLRAALTLVNAINHETVIVKSIGVSGVLHKAKEYLTTKEVL